MKPFYYISLLLLSASLCSACGQNIRHAIGITKKSPDAFKVVSNPPLSIPPDFSLPTPQAGATGLNQPPISEQAKQDLFQTGKIVHRNNQTIGEFALLQVAGADSADPEIRQILRQDLIDEENRQKEDGFFSNLLGQKEEASKDPVVAANKEKERIQENQKSGDPVTKGETPTVKSSNRGGLFNRLLGK